MRWRAGNIRTPGIGRQGQPRPRRAARVPGRRRRPAPAARPDPGQHDLDRRDRARLRRVEVRPDQRRAGARGDDPVARRPVARRRGAATGTHVMSVLVQWMPKAAPEGDWAAQRDGDRRPRVWTLETVAPGHRRAGRRAPGPDARRPRDRVRPHRRPPAPRGAGARLVLPVAAAPRLGALPDAGRGCTSRVRARTRAAASPAPRVVTPRARSSRTTSAAQACSSARLLAVERSSRCRRSTPSEAGAAGRRATRGRRPLRDPAGCCRCRSRRRHRPRDLPVGREGVDDLRQERREHRQQGAHVEPVFADSWFTVSGPERAAQPLRVHGPVGAGARPTSRPRRRGRRC